MEPINSVGRDKYEDCNVMAPGVIKLSADEILVNRTIKGVREERNELDALSPDLWATFPFFS